MGRTGTGQASCPFCKVDALLGMLPPTDGGENIPCRRGIYEDPYCIATLAAESYATGHTLVILRQHRRDIADTCITEEEKKGFIEAIHKVATHLKATLGEIYKPPERIYVGILCDGVEHLHAHLIPRYEFSKDDEEIYRQLFWQRDGVDKVRSRIRKKDMGGFWYLSEREQHYKRYQTSEAWARTDKERAAYLEALAKDLRLPS